MRRLLAIICPPLAVLLCGKPFSAILNAFLCCFFWLPGVGHALMVVDDRFQDKRTRRIANPLEQMARSMERERVRETRRKRPEPRQPVMDPHRGVNGTVFRQRN